MVYVNDVPFGEKSFPNGETIFNTSNQYTRDANIRRAEMLLDPYFIVFTANPHKEENIAFLEAEGLPYDAINENADFIGRYGDGLKVYYNLLLDDKAGLKEAYDALDRLCDDYEEVLLYNF